MPDFLTDVHDRVATLTLNRPDKLNALSGEILRGAVPVLKEWVRDPEVGAIVLTGTGRAFCAGGDVGKFLEGKEDKSLEQRVDELREMQDLSWMLYNLPKVTLAAVNGFAMGAGLGIALACDLRIASSEAKFGTAYAKVGFGGDFGTTWLLARYAGAPKAKEMFFLADPIDAAEAHRLGIVNRAVPAAELAGTAQEMASRIAHGPLTSYRYMKANVNFAQSVDFRTLMDREAETHTRCGQTEDHREGVRAFLEKRAAHFTGR
jgi:2-(1,2-epoxy-1,2-dihydrophenyl)acetyl-CoA isomerase